MPHKDPEKRRRYQHEYYLRQKAEDYEGIKERNRGSYRRNKSTVLARTGRYYQENKERHAKWMRVWWRRNKERLREYRSEMNRKWRQENPEKGATRKARRRAHQLAMANTLTPEQIEFERSIGEATYPGEELHLHHLVSFSKGGGHTWGNIAFIPASLNLSIKDKLPGEVYEQQQIWNPAEMVPCLN